MEESELFDALLNVVQKTGQDLWRRLPDHAIVCREKSSFQDLVTNEDERVQTELMQALHTLLPEAAVVAEEKDNRPVKGLTWIIDPIDGTTNFVSMQKNFAISVALHDGHQTRMGVVYDVAADECFSALRGQGASCNGLPLCPPPSVHELKHALLDVSLSSINNLSRRTGKPLHFISREIRGQRALGSAALAICHIARGDIQLYLSAKLFPWDHAAAGLVLSEVGGTVAALDPADDLFSIQQTPVIACANPLLGDALRTYILSEAAH